MKYREFTDSVKARLGNVDWGMLGKLHQKYEAHFILDMINKLPPYMDAETPKKKIIYLTAICRKYATRENIKSVADIDFSGFKLGDINGSKQTDT